MQNLLSNPEAPIIAFTGVFFLLIVTVILLSLKVRKLLRGKNAQSLEDTIVELQKNVSELQEFKEDSEAYLENVEARLRRSVQSIETIRFNPWKGMGEGGNQSFATALLTEDGDGVVISSLHSRDRVSVFSKPVKKHASEYELTEEEIQALKLSQESVAAGKTLHL